LNAAELIALADAHGIDFIHVAGSSNRSDGIAGKRRRVIIEIDPGVTEESRRKKRIEAPDSAKGKGSRVAKAATWSHAELGMAAGGVDQNGRLHVSALHWAAAQHTIANDRRPETIRTLMCGLRYHANKWATEGNWEATVPCRREPVKRDPKTQVVIAPEPRRSVLYLEPLCMLVLDEISFKPAFTKAPGLYAIYLGVDERTWDKMLEERFSLLKARYAGWYGSGLGEIQRRINGDGEERVA
jgi:hypothetical protein